jgi:hypothetical protein
LLKKSIQIIITIIILTIVIIQFPRLFIDRQFEYSLFKIHSNDRIELNEDVKNILDSVLINLTQSDFYNDKEIFELYFVKDTFYEKLISVFGMNNIASSKYNKHIYIGYPEFRKNTLTKEGNEYEWLNLVQVVTHEAVHSQMYTDYSKFGFMVTPSWINEGYAEYISYYKIREQHTYPLSKLFERYQKSNHNWVKTEFGSLTPKQYLRDRILIEYLIDEKTMSIDDIIKDEYLKPEEILEEIKEKYLEN